MALSEAEELELLGLEAAQSAPPRAPAETPSDKTPVGALFGQKAIADRFASANDKRKEIGLDPIQQPKNSVGELLKQFFLTGTDAPGSQESAKAMMDSMGAPGKYIRQKVSKLAESTGMPALKPGEDSFMDILHKQVGLPKAISVPLGMVADVGTDPYASFVGSHGFANAAEGTRPAFNSIKRMLTLRNPEGYSSFSPVGANIQEAGRKLYGLPFKKADQRVGEFRDSASRGPYEFTDQLWNGGNPEIGGFGTPSLETQAQIEQKLKDAWTPVKETLESSPVVHGIAPGFTRGKQTARAEAIEAHVESVGKRAADMEEKRLAKIPGFGDIKNEQKAQIIESARAKAKADAMAAAHESVNNDRDLFEAVAGQGEDQYVRDTKRRLMGQIVGGPNEHEAAINEIKEAAPALSDQADYLREMFRNGDSVAATTGAEELLKDLMVGDRSTLDLHELAKKYRTQAAGSENFMTNAYKKGNKVNARSAMQMKRGASLSDMVEGAVHDAAESAVPGSGPAALEKFQGQKDVYGALARGMPKARQVANQAAAKPGLSWIDMMLLAKGHPGIEALVKGNQLINHNPRFGTGTGMLLNNIGKSNAWDRMLMKGMNNETNTR